MGRNVFESRQIELTSFQKSFDYCMSAASSDFGIELAFRQESLLSVSDVSLPLLLSLFPWFTKVQRSAVELVHVVRYEN